MPSKRFLLFGRQQISCAAPTDLGHNGPSRGSVSCQRQLRSPSSPSPRSRGRLPRPTRARSCEQCQPLPWGSSPSCYCWLAGGALHVHSPHTTAPCRHRGRRLLHRCHSQCQVSRGTSRSCTCCSPTPTSLHILATDTALRTCTLNTSTRSSNHPWRLDRTCGAH